MNNKGEDLLAERTHLLNRFIQMLSTNPTIWYSDEVQKFTRPQQDVISTLTLIADLSTDQLIERITLATKIEISHFSNSQVQSFSDQIREFIVKIKGVFPLLE